MSRLGKEYHKAWRDKNKEKLRLQRKEWRKKNRERLLLREAAYREANREKLREAYRAREEKRRKYRRDNRYSILILSTLKGRAIKKGLDFDITLEWLQERFEKGICEATGRSFDFSGGRAKINSPSIDRKDSTKGYTKDNCRVVIWGWNAACNRWGEKALLEMVNDFERNQLQ